jgi:hypothetical protein
LPFGDDGGGGGSGEDYYVVSATILIDTRPRYVVDATIEIDTRPRYIVEQTLEFPPLTYAIGTAITFNIAVYYGVSATIEFGPYVYAASATIEFDPASAPYKVSTTVSFRPDVHTVANAQTVWWNLSVTLGGTDITTRLSGDVTIEREEDASALAEMLYVPTAGSLDPLMWLGKEVRIWWIQLNSAGVELNRRLRYTGLVSDTQWDADNRTVKIQCTTDLQGVFDRLTRAQIDEMVPGSWSEWVFSEDSQGWSYAEDRQSTTELTIWHDEMRMVRNTSIRAAVSATYTFGDDDRLDELARLEYADRQSITNVINVALDYRFERKRHREVTFSWMPYSFVGSGGVASLCMYLDDPYPLCQRGMIESAANGNGWVLQGEIRYIPVWPAGSYNCGGGDLKVWGFEEVPWGQYIVTRKQNFTQWCIGAWWKSAKRWLQTVTETYDLQVRCSDSVDEIGELVDTLDYGVESQADNSGWESSLDDTGYPVGSLVINFGDYYLDSTEDDSAGRDVLEDVQDMVLAIASANLLRAHRGTSVSFRAPFQPMVRLDQTIKLESTGLVAQGKVRRISDTFGLDSGEASTEIEIALSRHNGTGLYTPSALTPPTQPAPPTEVAPSTRVHLGLYLGGRLASMELPEDANGYLADYQYDPEVTLTPDWYYNPENPNVKSYGQQFIARAPDIEEDYTDPVEVTAAEVYEVIVPEDLLELTA